MFLHVIEHDRTRDEALAAQGARVRSLAGVVPPMNGERRRLGEGLAAHCAQIGSLAGVNPLVDHVVLSVSEALAAHVADEGPRPVNGLVAGQRLDRHELFGARVARIRGRGLVRRGDGAVASARTVRGRGEVVRGVGRVTTGGDAARRGGAPRRRFVSFGVMVVEIPGLEPHQAARTRVRLVLAGHVHPLVTLEEGAIAKARLAPVAAEGLLADRLLAVRARVAHRAVRLHQRRRGRRRRVGHLVHPQVAQGRKRSRAQAARVLDVGLVNVVTAIVMKMMVMVVRRAVRHVHRMARSHVIVELRDAAELETAALARMGLDVDLEVL